MSSATRKRSRTPSSTSSKRKHETRVNLFLRKNKLTMVSLCNVGILESKKKTTRI